MLCLFVHVSTNFLPISQNALFRKGALICLRVFLFVLLAFHRYMHYHIFIHINNACTYIVHMYTYDGLKSSGMQGQAGGLHGQTFHLSFAFALF